MARNPIEILRRLEQQLDRRLMGVINKHSRRVKEKLRADQPLKPRSRRRFPYLSRPAHWEKGRLVATVYSPVPWVGAHIGPRGSVTTISPKRGQYLALPTDFVKTVRGHPVSPRRYTDKVILKGIIFGRAGWHGSAGLRQRRAAGERFRREDLVPLYILKGRVVIRRRIHPELLIDWVKPGFYQDLKKIIGVQ